MITYDTTWLRVRYTMQNSIAESSRDNVQLTSSRLGQPRIQEKKSWRYRGILSYYFVLSLYLGRCSGYVAHTHLCKVIIEKVNPQWFQWTRSAVREYITSGKILQLKPLRPIDTAQASSHSLRLCCFPNSVTHLLKRKLMAKIPVFFLLLLCVLETSLALKDTGKVEYRTQIGTACKAKSGRCCRFSSACSMGYFLQGAWSTDIDTKPTSALCRSACDRHRKKCEFACRCLAEDREVRSSKVCKCHVGEKDYVIRNSCFLRCTSAENMCVYDCVTSEQCPAKAVTKLSWYVAFPGKCSQVCPPHVDPRLPQTNLPICPVVATIAP